MDLFLLDAFNRSDGDPGANWAQAVNTYSLPSISGNALAWPQFPSAHWTTKFAKNQGVYVELTGGAQSVQFLLRWQNPNSGNERGYAMQGSFGGTGAAEAWRWENGAAVRTLGFFNGVIAGTDTWLLGTIVQNELAIYGSSDGSSWTLRQTWTDTEGPILLPGYIGIYHPNNTTAGSINNFGGGQDTDPVDADYSLFPKELLRR